MSVSQGLFSNLWGELSRPSLHLQSKDQSHSPPTDHLVFYKLLVAGCTDKASQYFLLALAASQRGKTGPLWSRSFFSVVIL